jgi:competence protein ComEC
MRSLLIALLIGGYAPYWLPHAQNGLVQIILGACFGLSFYYYIEIWSISTAKALFTWFLSTLILVCVGYWYTDFQLASRQNQANELAGNHLISGIIISSPICRQHRMNFVLQVNGSSLLSHSTMVHVQVNHCGLLKAGDHVELTGHGRLVHPLNNFYRPWQWLAYWSDRPSMTWKATKYRILKSRSWYQHPIMVLQDRMHHALKNWAISDRFMACVSAWVLGLSQGLTTVDRQVLANTGTAHLMAISGLHIGLIFNLTLKALLRFIPYSSVRWPVGLVMRTAAWCIVGLFVVFSGSHWPSLRALLMLAVYVIFYAMRLPVHMAEVLAISIILLFLVDPLMIWSLSAILSSLAVWGLITAGQSVKKVIFVQWQLWWFLIPVNLFFFSGLSLSSLVANLVAIPYATFLVPIILISAVFLMVLPILGQYFMLIAYGLFCPFWWVLEQLSNLPYSYFNLPAWSGVTLIAALIAMLWVSVFVQSIVYRSCWYLVIVTCGWWFSTHTVESGAYRLTVLDVGHGLSTVIQTANHVLVYDTGGQFYDPSGMARFVLKPFLQASGIRHIDRLVISHDDVDHAGGKDWLIQHLPIRDLLMPKIDKKYHLPTIHCRAGDQWVWDGVKFQVLAPKWLTNRSNDHSCVIMVSGPKRTLLTGDASAWSEQQMLFTNHADLSADYLMVPHHGSLTSSTDSFLHAVSPSIAIVSVAYYDPYRLPHPLVEQRYLNHGIRWLSTAKQGAVQLDVKKHKTTVNFAVGKWSWIQFHHFNQVYSQ